MPGNYNELDEFRGDLEAPDGTSAPNPSYVLTTGAYDDPDWFVALDWAKITNTPTTLAGYGITDGGGGSSNIEIGNSLFVDQVNGTPYGVRGRLDEPFQTLKQAKDAAIDGDTIFVRPGTYDERDLLKNGVNWLFAPGSRVLYTGSSGSIWDDTSDGANGAVISIIGGAGVFTHDGTGAAGKRNVFKIANAGSILHVECDTIDASGGESFDCAIWQTGGIIQVRAKNILAADLGLYWEDGDMHVEADRIIATAEQAVYSNATTASPTGKFWVRANYIESAGMEAVHAGIAGTSANIRMWVEAFEIVGATCGVRISATGKYYVRANKISRSVAGTTTDAAVDVRAGEVWVDVMKITNPDGTGCGLRMGSGTARLWARVQSMENLGACTNVVRLANAGNLAHISIGDCVGATSTGGANVSAGTLYFDGRIDTAANAITSPITKSGGTLVLGAGTVLIAESSRDSITASTAQNVIALGAWANKGVNANITITTPGGLVVDSNVA